MSILSSKTADCCLQRRLFYTIPPCPRGYSLVPKARRRRSTHAHVSGQAGLQCLLRCDWLRGIHPNVVLLYPASNMICGARIVCAPTSVAHCGLSSPPPLHLQLFSPPFSPPPPPPASSSPPPFLLLLPTLALASGRTSNAPTTAGGQEQRRKPVNLGPQEVLDTHARTEAGSEREAAL